jgi:CRP-like cAMP-binding protein
MASDYAPIPVEDFLDPDDPTLFPRLTSEQIEYLAEIGSQLTFARGDVVFEHGQRETPLYVVQSGAIDVIDHAPEGDRYFTQCRAGTFAADISMFTGEPTLAAGYAAEPTSLLALPPEDVRRVVATTAELGDLLLRTMVTRREWLQGRGLGQQRLIGSRWSGESFAVRELLERNLVPFTWHDLARRRPGRARHGGLRLLGGPRHARGRALRPGRSGGHERADRELPRLSDGPDRRRARAAGDAPGAKVRRRDLQRP